MSYRRPTVGILIATLFFAAPASANFGLSGRVFCDVNDNQQTDVGIDLPLDGVVIDVEGDGGFSDSEATVGGGNYFVSLSTTPQSYTATLDESTIPGGGTTIVPPGGTYGFTTTVAGESFERDFLVDSPICDDEPEGACWLTAGGVKFSQITDTPVAEKGPQHSFGGNVFPSCSPEPGNGGQWNHVAHSLKLHFLGTDIFTVACGNVPGIPEGSESPVTDVNYIEFEGTGWIAGIKGNKLEKSDVFFFARAEDRNEPGNEHAAAGEDIDRYFLHVFADEANPNGSTLILIDGNGDPSDVDPVTITGGNLQMHQSSCEE